MTDKSLILQEKTILAYLFKHPEKIFDVQADDFSSHSAKTIFISLEHLRSSGKKINYRNLAIEVTKEKPYLDESRLKDEIDIEVTESFESIYAELRQSKAHHEIGTIYQTEFMDVALRKTPSIEKLKEIHERIGDSLNRINYDPYEIYTAQSMLDEYKKQIANRLDGKSGFYDTGCAWLNKALSEGFAPGKITVVYASSGSGKSTFAEYLVERQINKQLPSLYMSLEMDLVTSVDRLIMMRHKIPMSELVNVRKEEDFESPLEGILQTEREKLGKMKYFRFVEKPGLTLADVKQIIRQVQKDMDQKYLIVTIDLLTMIKDFNKGVNKANDYEHALNELHEIAKELGVHIFGVVQSRRPNEKVSVKTIEDLEKFRPQIEQIKNSSAIEERSRIILSAFRKKFYAEKYLPDAPELEIMDDIMEITVNKQNTGKVGTIVEYLFDGETSCLTPFDSDDIV